MNIKKEIETLIYEAEGFDTVVAPLMNVKNSRGEIYQIQLVATKDDIEIVEATCFPDMKIYDGELIEDN